MQSRLLDRKELLVFGSNIARAKPVPVPLPFAVRVGCLWGGGDAGRPDTSLATSLLLHALHSFLDFRFRDRA